ncbi:hypothetical protein AADZ90_012180 [Aestuariibius sp. 2305UL40-4]|uniref:hypothetical protein n=1 Tax=Aestuariibius violaceus TaxID=3234132 RepID=UPI00345E3C3C
MKIMNAVLLALLIVGCTAFREPTSSPASKNEFPIDQTQTYLLVFLPSDFTGDTLNFCYTEGGKSCEASRQSQLRTHLYSFLTVASRYYSGPPKALMLEYKGRYALFSRADFTDGGQYVLQSRSRLRVDFSRIIPNEVPGLFPTEGIVPVIAPGPGKVVVVSQTEKGPSALALAEAMITANLGGRSASLTYDIATWRRLP